MLPDDAVTHVGYIVALVVVSFVITVEAAGVDAVWALTTFTPSQYRIEVVEVFSAIPVPALVLTVTV
jgi:hypothetical protein